MADIFASPMAEALAHLGGARLTDESHVAKWRSWAAVPDVDLGTARRQGSSLVLCAAPGELLTIGERPDVDPVVDLTHVRAAIRLTGERAAWLLSHVCALDLSEAMTPNGAAARTLVAGVATEIVRDDRDGEPSYLLLPSRSFARSVWTAIEEAARLS